MILKDLLMDPGGLLIASRGFVMVLRDLLMTRRISNNPKKLFSDPRKLFNGPKRTFRDLQALEYIRRLLMAPEDLKDLLILGCILIALGGF